MIRSSKQFFIVFSLILSLPSASMAVDLDWNLFATGDYYDSDWWLPTQVPTFDDDVFIRNSGDAVANFGAPVQAHSFTVGDAATNGPEFFGPDGGLWVHGAPLQVSNNLLVAANSSSQETPSDFTGVDGFLRVSQSPLLEVADGGEEHEFRVGYVNVRPGGSVYANGQVRLETVSTVTTANDLIIGGANNEGGNADANGLANWWRITDLSIPGDLDAAVAQFRGVSQDATGDTRAFLEFRDITNFSVGGDFGIGRNDYVAGPTAPFDIRHDSFANANPIQEIDSLTVGGDFEVGTATVDFQAGTDQVLVNIDNDAVFKVVSSMTVAGNFYVASFRGTDENNLSTFQQILGGVVANFHSVPSAQIVGEVHVGVIDLDSSTDALHVASRYESGAQLFLEASEMVTGGPMRVGVIAGEANIQNADAFATLPMQAATLTTPELRLGVIDNPGVAGSAGATVSLLGSFIDTGLLVEGEDARIRFHLDGLERITIDTFDGTLLSSVDDHYSAIDAADALLQGEIVSDFDFTPDSPGPHSFDLVRTDDVTALDDISADLAIVDLPEDFCVIFYGVAEEGDVDILRLTIGHCDIPEPASGVLLMLGGMALAFGRRTRGRRRG